MINKKQVTMDMLKQQVETFEEFIEIPVSFQNQEYQIKLYPYFSPVKIRSLVENIIEFYKNAEKEKLVVPEGETDDLVGYFVTRAFTDMVFTRSKKAKKIYEEFKIALNAPVFKLLLQSFPQESIAAVYERIQEVIEAGAKIESIVKNAQKMIQEMPLENRDVLFGEKKKKLNVEM